MTRKLELSYDDFLELRDYATSLELDTFSTPFDMDSIKFLEKSGQNIWKIPSGEVTNLPFLERIAKFKVNKKKVILSTGMCTIGEVHRAVDVLCKYEDPKNLIILHCNTEYPTPDKDVNLSAIDTLHSEFPDIEIGFSDHSVGYVAAVGACMKNIVLIEKHFTLDKSFPGPDHKASATPEELKELCHNVRRIEVMAGGGGYRRSTVVALGLAHYKNESMLLHAGVSYAGGGDNHLMANAGVTWKFGNRSAEASVPDMYRRGPMESERLLGSIKISF